MQKKKFCCVIWVLDLFSVSKSLTKIFIGHRREINIDVDVLFFF